MLAPPHCSRLHAHNKPHFPDVLEALKTLAETIECVLTVVILYTNNARWNRETFVAINNEVCHNFRYCSEHSRDACVSTALWLTAFVVGLGGVGCDGASRALRRWSPVAGSQP